MFGRFSVHAGDWPNVRLDTQDEDNELDIFPSISYSPETKLTLGVNGKKGLYFFLSEAF